LEWVVDGLAAVDLFAAVPAGFRFAFLEAALLFCPGLAALDARYDEARECFARCRIVFGGAASATEPSANAVTSAAASILIVPRIIGSSSGVPVP